MIREIKSDKWFVHKIVFFLVDQTEVIVRTCHWEKNYAESDCYKGSIDSNGTSHGKILFCEICDTDGCNTGISRIHKSIAVLISTLIILKILAFWYFVGTIVISYVHTEINANDTNNCQENKLFRLCFENVRIVWIKCVCN